MNLSEHKLLTVVVGIMFAAVCPVCGEGQCSETGPEEIIEEYLKLPHPENDMMGEARQVRWDVLRKLKATPDQSVDAIAIALTKINHRWQRYELVGCLESFFLTERSAEILCSLLDDEDVRVRRNAVHGLRRMYKRVEMVGSEPLLSYLIKAAGDSSADVRISALYALSDRVETGAVDTIRERLKDESSEVRFYAACFLTEYGELYGLGELKAALARFRSTDTDDREWQFHAKVERLLKSFERITYESMGTIPMNPNLMSNLDRMAWAAKRYETLLDAWSVWWGWDGEAAEKAVEKDGRTFTEILAEHSSGTVESLAVRSRPDVRGEIATEAFYDILKLRETGKAESVTMLECVMSVVTLGYIMEENLYSGRIHGFAAAQALFCIGNKEAISLLDKYLLDNRYNAALGVRYAHHWEMAEPGRSRFIEKYHMRNRSKNLWARLSVRQMDEDEGRPIGYRPTVGESGQRFEFTVSLTNISDKPFCVLEQKRGYGDFLYFQDESGKFAQRLETATKCYKMDNKWPAIGPGEMREYKTVLRVMDVGRSNKFLLRYLEEGQLWIEERPSNAFLAGQPGKFKVYAMF